MNLNTQPASRFSSAELADLFNRSFEGYFMPVNLNEAAMQGLLDRDNVDLDASRILLDDSEPAGLALIARRGAESRLAAMGIVTSARGQGAGSWLMPRLCDEARQRGETRIHLEVIAQNTAAIRLYEKFGFQKVRQLFGYVCEKPDGVPGDAPAACDPAIIADLVAAHGLPNLPWQVDADTLRRTSAFGFRVGAAYAALSNPEAEHVAFRALIVEPAARHQGQAATLLGALFSRFAGKTWHVPAIFPEEMGGVFEKAGFRKEEISQFQMDCAL